jgi:hypothetical protein
MWRVGTCRRRWMTTMRCKNEPTIMIMTTPHCKTMSDNVQCRHNRKPVTNLCSCAALVRGHSNHLGSLEAQVSHCTVRAPHCWRKAWQGWASHRHMAQPPTCTGKAQPKVLRTSPPHDSLTQWAAALLPTSVSSTKPRAKMTKQLATAVMMQPAVIVLARCWYWPCLYHWTDSAVRKLSAL